MRRKSPQKLSATQEKKLYRAIIIIAVLGLAWVIFAPRNGLMAVLAERRALLELESQTKALAKENADMENEINRLKNDPAHLENLARQEYKMLKKNERVFDFAKPEDTKKK